MFLDEEREIILLFKKVRESIQKLIFSFLMTGNNSSHNNNNNSNDFCAAMLII